MNLLHRISAPSLLRRRTPIQLSHRRPYSIASAEYDKRNYANNAAEYNTVIGSLVAQRRNHLLRDVYDDMTLDGVQPLRDAFHSLVAGTMKGSRLQDAFFFRDEMMANGLPPDVNLYNFLISTCGKCKNSDAAIKLLEEMKKFGLKPNGEIYICLLNACAATGRTDHVFAIIRDMTAAGLGLNKFCYAGLIAAFKNRLPTTDETFTKIVEYVKQSKGWTSPEAASDGGENVMMNVSLEELYNMPTAELVHRRAFVNRQLTVYHVAVHACAELKSKETFIEGAMVGYTPRGMAIAQEALEQMIASGFFLNPRMGSDLLLAAAGEKEGGYTTANYIWDLLENRNIVPFLPAVTVYYKGLKEREIPADDPRLLKAGKMYDNLLARFGRSARFGRRST